MSQTTFRHQRRTLIPVMFLQRYPNELSLEHSRFFNVWHELLIGSSSVSLFGIEGLICPCHTACGLSSGVKTYNILLESSFNRAPSKRFKVESCEYRPENIRNIKSRLTASARLSLYGPWMQTHRQNPQTDYDHPFLYKFEGNLAVRVLTNKHTHKHTSGWADGWILPSALSSSLYGGKILSV